MSNQVVVAITVPLVLQRLQTPLNQYQNYIFEETTSEPIVVSDFELQQKYLLVGDVGDLPPHQQRVHVERAQLADRITKLTAFVGTPTYLALPTSESVLLRRQLTAMTEYRQILDERLFALNKKES